MAVEADSHLIAAYNVTTKPTDHGEITETLSEVKNDLEHEIVEVVADKSYQDPKDMANALAAGIIPNVIQRDGNDVAEVEFEHIEAAVTDEMLNSTKPEDLERCLEAGKIPTAYAGILDTPQIGVRKSYECTAPSNIKEMSDEEL